MRLAPRCVLRCLPLLAIALGAFATPASALTLTLRSGNAAPGNPDPLIQRLDLATSCGVGYPTAFTAAEFTAAVTGPSAVVLSFIHPAWTPSLMCDPLAKWVGTSATANPLSALYAMEFYVPDPCCFTRATLDFCWLADDGLGDAVNPAGLYVNQTPIAAVTGGNFVAQSTVIGIDVTGLVHCGKNTIHVYNRDIGCAVSGVIYSARLRLDDCITPVAPSSWGSVKQIYR